MLRKLRKEAGYDSSRAFFKAGGGEAGFRCTYRQYLNIETGRSKARPRVLEQIVSRLPLGDKDRARDFFTAYLHMITGSERLAHAIIGTFLETPPEMRSAQPPLVEGMAGAVNRNAVSLTKEQSRFVVAKEEHYWPYIMLTNDSGHWGVQELSRATGQRPAGLRKILDRMARLKLLKKDDDGKYYCPDAGKVFMHPRDKPFAVKHKPLRELWERMLRKQGEDMLHNSFFIRASETTVRQYMPFLNQTLRGADVCTTVKKGRDTGFFLLEFRVRKVLPF